MLATGRQLCRVADTPPSIVSSGCLAVPVAVYACVRQCMSVSSCPRKVSKMLTVEEQRENVAASITIFCSFTYNPIHACYTDLQSVPLIKTKDLDLGSGLHKRGWAKCKKQISLCVVY